MSDTHNRCVICKSGLIEDSPGYSSLLRVTSDSKLWKTGGHIGICQTCGVVQKRYDDSFSADADKIYQDYEIYFQGRGAEQKIFKNGIGLPRSEVLVEYLLTHIDDNRVDQQTSWLDLGCGSGHLLRTLASRSLNIQLYGADISEKSRKLIEGIDGVLGYYGNGLEGIDKQFNVLSLSHVLEHVESPVSFLVSVKNHITPDGYLIVAVPNWTKNPFDLLVADHSFHFMANDLSRVVEAAGFDILAMSEDYIPKELILIAKKSNRAQHAYNLHNIKCANQNSIMLNKVILWLNSLVLWARENCRESNVGVFGTAIAATWLDGVCQSAFSFFSDEDEDRSDSQYLNRIVYQPKDTPISSKILVPLPSFIADLLCSRLNQLNRGSFCPPPTCL